MVSTYIREESDTLWLNINLPEYEQKVNKNELLEEFKLTFLTNTLNLYKMH